MPASKQRSKRRRFFAEVERGKVDRQPISKEHAALIEALFSPSTWYRHVTQMHQMLGNVQIDGKPITKFLKFSDPEELLYSVPCVLVDWDEQSRDIRGYASTRFKPNDRHFRPLDPRDRAALDCQGGTGAKPSSAPSSTNRAIPSTQEQTLLKSPAASASTPVPPKNPTPPCRHVEGIVLEISNTVRWIHVSVLCWISKAAQDRHFRPLDPRDRAALDRQGGTSAKPSSAPSSTNRAISQTSSSPKQEQALVQNLAASAHTQAATKNSTPSISSEATPSSSRFHHPHALGQSRSSSTDHSSGFGSSSGAQASEGKFDGAANVASHYTSLDLNGISTDDLRANPGIVQYVLSEGPLEQKSALIGHLPFLLKRDAELFQYVARALKTCFGEFADCVQLSTADRLSRSMDGLATDMIEKHLLPAVFGFMGTTNHKEAMCILIDIAKQSITVLVEQMKPVPDTIWSMLRVFSGFEATHVQQICAAALVGLATKHSPFSDSHRETAISVLTMCRNAKKRDLSLALLHGLVDVTVSMGSLADTHILPTLEDLSHCEDPSVSARTFEVACAIIDYVSTSARQTKLPDILLRLARRSSPEMKSAMTKCVVDLLEHPSELLFGKDVFALLDTLRRHLLVTWSDQTLCKAMFVRHAEPMLQHALQHDQQFAAQVVDEFISMLTSFSGQYVKSLAIIHLPKVMECCTDRTLALELVACARRLISPGTNDDTQAAVVAVLTPMCARLLALDSSQQNHDSLLQEVVAFLGHLPVELQKRALSHIGGLRDLFSEEPLREFVERCCRHDDGTLGSIASKAMNMFGSRDVSSNSDHIDVNDQKSDTFVQLKTLYGVYELVPLPSGDPYTVSLIHHMHRATMPTIGTLCHLRVFEVPMGQHEGTWLDFCDPSSGRPIFQYRIAATDYFVHGVIPHGELDTSSIDFHRFTSTTCVTRIRFFGLRSSFECAAILKELHKSSKDISELPLFEDIQECLKDKRAYMQDIKQYRLTDRKMLGRGSYGSVFEVVKTAGGVGQGGHFAIKQSVFMAHADKAPMVELFTLREADHPHLMRCVEMFLHPLRQESPKEVGSKEILRKSINGDVSQEVAGAQRWLISLVLPLADTNAQYYLQKGVAFDEGVILKLFDQIGSGLVYMHIRDWLHRDLKLDNVVLRFDGQNPGDFIARVSDFGTALLKQSNNGNLRTLNLTTPTYEAPEMISTTTQPRGVYTKKVDVWALGVALYTYSFCEHPFAYFLNDHSKRIMMYHGELPPLDFPSSDVFPMPRSVGLKLLISRCLSLNPDDRPTSEEFLAEVRRLRARFDGGEHDDIPGRPNFASGSSLAKELIESLVGLRRERERVGTVLLAQLRKALESQKKLVEASRDASISSECRLTMSNRLSEAQALYAQSRAEFLRIYHTVPVTLAFMIEYLEAEYGPAATSDLPGPNSVSDGASSHITAPVQMQDDTNSPSVSIPASSTSTASSSISQNFSKKGHSANSQSSSVIAFSHNIRDLGSSEDAEMEGAPIDRINESSHDQQGPAHVVEGPNREPQQGSDDVAPSIDQASSSSSQKFSKKVDSANAQESSALAVSHNIHEVGSSEDTHMEVASDDRVSQSTRGEQGPAHVAEGADDGPQQGSGGFGPGVDISSGESKQGSGSDAPSTDQASSAGTATHFPSTPSSRKRGSISLEEGLDISAVNAFQASECPTPKKIPKAKEGGIPKRN